MDGTERSGPRRSRRFLFTTLAAIVAIVMIAAAAVAILGLPGNLPGMPGGDNGGDQDVGPGDGGSQGALAIGLKEGDFIEFMMTTDEGNIIGSARVTFRNITSTTYDVELTKSVNGQIHIFTWKAEANDIVGAQSDVMKDRSRLGELVGEKTIDTAFGPRKVVQYRNTSIEGVVTDLYIGKTTPVLYRTVITDSYGSNVTIEMNDTNISGIRNANV